MRPEPRVHCLKSPKHCTQSDLGKLASPARISGAVGSERIYNSLRLAESKRAARFLRLLCSASDDAQFARSMYSVMLATRGICVLSAFGLRSMAGSIYLDCRRIYKRLV